MSRWQSQALAILLGCAAVRAAAQDDIFNPLLGEPPEDAVQEAPAAPAAEADAQPEAPPERGDLPRRVDYIWLGSQPPGASVFVNDEARGTSPAFVSGLKPGFYSVRLEMDGFEPQFADVEVPNSGEQEVMVLRQQRGVFRLTSEPSHMSVALGPRLIGRTPLVIRDLAPGTYQLKVFAAGYDTESVDAVIDPEIATGKHLKMVSNIGSISITTTPPQTKIFVDNTLKGEGQPDPAHFGRSLPLRVDGFKHGRHRVHLEYHGAASEPKLVEVARNAVTQLHVTMWYPDVRVQRMHGQPVIGMLLDKNATGDLVVARSEVDHVRIRATEVKVIEELTAAESAELLKHRRREQD